MTAYEYRVVPAPSRGVKVKGAKTTEARFAHALSELMNALADEGWEYQRADTLPCEERVGLTGRRTRHHSMLVFRRALPGTAQAADRTADVPVAPIAEPAAVAAASPAPRLAHSAPQAVEPEPEARRPRSSALVARRIAETLGRRSAGNGPVLHAVPDGDSAPRIGGAKGNGLVRPES
jgi:hypothetical protein